MHKKKYYKSISSGAIIYGVKDKKGTLRGKVIERGIKSVWPKGSYVAVYGLYFKTIQDYKPKIKTYEIY
jgi:hypothetical protein